MRQTFTTIETEEDKQFLRDMKLTLTELELIDIRRDYEVFRKRYFKNSNLPSVENVAIHFVEAKVMGRLLQDGTSKETLGYCMPGLSPQAAVIYLKKGVGRQITRATLLHEMAHISAEIRYGRKSNGHGALWQREMKRLAKLDAFRNYW